MSVYDIPLRTLEGKETSLKEYEGEVVMVVNVASKCGFTPQYSGLEEIYERYQDKGFIVLGFPCNQFLFQEPGGADTINACTLNYGVTFPIMEKVKVRGPNKHPLYKELLKAKTDKGSGGNIKWNFEKFVIGRDGNVVGRFRSNVEPTSAEITSRIESALAG
jgi:glutathione peroxidase